MPLTTSQATEYNLVNSIKDWIVTNVAAPYNAQTSSKPYAAPLQVILGSPADPSVLAQTPVVIINLPRDRQAPSSLGLGEGIVWVYKEFRLYVYPAVDGEGRPNVESALILRSLIHYAFGTALTMVLNDYSTVPPVVLKDRAYVEDQELVTYGIRASTASALERHRFDYRFCLKYTQAAING